MAIINFPSSPSLYQTFTVGSKTWVWNGYAWDIQLQTGVSFAFAQASFNTANNALANTGVLVTSNTLTQYIIANTTNSISTSTGALQVQGGVGVTGNIYSNAIYTNGLFYSANGNPISTGGGTTFTASNTAPSTPKYGDQWYFIASDIVYEYATNGTASFWLDVTSDSVATNVTTVSAETQLSPFLFMGAT
jgi:hypothetical protein